MIKLRVHIIGYILVISTSIASAQEYIPMNFDNGRWFVEVFEKGGYYEWIQYYCNGDTIIDGHEYSKLFRNKLSLKPLDDFDSIDTIAGSNIGAIRNAENKQVIFTSPLVYDSAVVLYDFNLSLGDTINGRYDHFIIKDIDSVKYCGKYLKRYTQIAGAGSFQVTLIEGIGFSNGLLGHLFSVFENGESTRILECYTEKNNLECPICENLLSVSINNISTEIYPIPTEDNIIIKSTKPISQVRFLNISGSPVLFQEYNNQFLIEESIADFLPGIYLVEVYFDDKTKNVTQILKN